MSKQLTNHTLCDSVSVPLSFNLKARDCRHWRVIGGSEKGQCVLMEYHGFYWFTLFYGNFKPINSVRFVSPDSVLLALRSTFKNLKLQLV